MAQLIKTDGTIIEIIPENKRHFKLRELYGILKCSLIEFVKTKEGDLMILDEEGKLKENWKDNINIEATDLYIQGHLDPIVGDVLICADKEIK